MGRRVASRTWGPPKWYGPVTCCLRPKDDRDRIRKRESLPGRGRLPNVYVQYCTGGWMTTQALAEYLGGRQALGRDIRSDLDLDDAIRSGLPVKAVESVVKTGALRASELHTLVIPRRTLAHRKRLGKRLSSQQSDRLTRVVRVVASAEEAIGDGAKARRWLRKPNRALQGQRPLDLLASDVGARLVERVLGRIEHGLGA